MTLLREIQSDVSSADADLAIILRKCKVLAARLRSEELAQWVGWELDGYPESQPLPGYRRLVATCYANFMNVAWHAERQPFLWPVLPKEARDALERIEFRDGVAKALAFARKGATIVRPELALLVQGKMYPEMKCFGAWMEVAGTEFDQLLSAVKNRILDFVLRVETENPDAGEAPANTQPVPPEKLQPLVQNFFGPVGNIAHGSHSFTQVSHVVLSDDDLRRLLVDFKTHLQELNLDPLQRRKAEAQLATLDAQLMGEPDPLIVRQAGRTLRNITEGAIGSLLAAAAQPTVWSWIHQVLAGL